MNVMQIQSIQDFEVIRSDPANEGKTFAVPRDVFEHYMSGVSIDQITDQEMSEINAMLGTTIANPHRIGLTRASKCGECGHTFSFADHVRVALEMSAHAKHELAKFISGDVYYLTVDTDKMRDVVCPQCKKPTVVIHCCYNTSWYGYASLRP